ncbi:SFT2-domain-containing protein [Russula earlei]|uniref:SFT2-domain-containing protein n=1 Tax=Russula earlei TaxID=71964 RepID=A0ACC0U252_9AGAM|nr:SFT2-domain-containing protein [Russula earlei]
MSSKGWFNLEAAGGTIPETQFFEGEPAFKFLNLTRTQRLYGFAACFAIGLVLSILGTVMLIVGGLASFAVLYALGTIVSLIGTGFLIGVRLLVAFALSNMLSILHTQTKQFAKQLKLMFKPVRVVATIVVLAMIVMIFISAFVIHSSTLCIIFVVLEYLAFLWYTLSYIPYARAAVLKVFGIS